ncbi:MAG: hypothetical protein CUN53_05180 [Phototrophicales bacterium]|nr:MAG: hypothetical protein CUN53_05180 [Phototrophicales bacterium]
MEVNIWIALIAGLVSFLSPCVLPLVPAYIGYMGGRVTNTVAAQTRVGILAQPTAISRISTFLHGMMFVLGFTFVFVVFGLLTTAFIRQVGGSNIALVRDIIGRVGGVVIIFFGLHFMGVLLALLRRLAASSLIASPLFTVIALSLAAGLLLWALIDWLIAVPAAALLALWMFISGGFSAPRQFWERVLSRVEGALYTDTRRQMVAKGEQSYASSALMGVVFAAGWTPCIGPIYGSILTLAATSSEISGAAGQMIAYSLGLGIPFLITAALLDSAQVGLRKLQRHLRTIELVSGAFLVIIGILVASGSLQRLSQTFANDFADFSYTLEECAAAWTQGQISLGEIGGCLEERSRFAPPSQSPGAQSSLNSAEAGTIGLGIGQIAPDFTAVTDTGDAVQLWDMRGEVVVLNFWATWCAPCRIEMPEFERAYQRGIARIVAVNSGESAEQIAAFRAEHGLTFPLALDEREQIQAQYGITNYPSTFIIDRDGVIRTRIFGALSPEQIEGLFNDPLIALS